MNKEKAKGQYRKLLALRLLEWRQGRGASQEDVAEVLGIQQPAYCKIEQGGTNLSAENAFKLAEYYGRKVDELLRVEHPVLNMHDHDPDRYNVILTQHQHGVSDEQFNQLGALIELQIGTSEVLVEQLTHVVEALAKPPQ
ncbi:MAG TPA: helix-turn-helix domain-containing protein [Flavobacteriales bacterium]|nr:helix-turn-helix domain-containing protein [Flavobacteriales bacterium]HRQ84788.1 helix-turn-helix domain-containing protein [Flavobacteriales bacterium]